MSYTCHPVFPHVKNELILKTDRRMKKVISISITLETVLYLIISISGYLSLGESQNMPSLIILRPKIGETDVFMQAALFLMLLVVMILIPINVFPVREQVMNLTGMKRSKWNSCWLTFVLLAFCFIVPIVYPNVLGLFGIAGGVFALSVGYVVPILMKLRIIG